MTIEVYTDGACKGNPGPGGWAWAVVGGPFGAGPADHTTNQRMEIQAVLEALRALAHEPGPIEVVSDSTYVVNCFRDGWWRGWRAKGWINSQRKPVANRDLWEPLVDLVEERGDVTFRWVKGHSGDVMNDLVDRLAVQAAETQQHRTGGGATADDGPVLGEHGVAPAEGAAGAGETSAASSTAPGGPADGLDGRLLVVVGHRPDRLGDAEALREHLADRLADRALVHDDLVVVSGLRMGAEMLGAEAAVDVGLPLLVVLPYPDPASSWADEAREHFEELAAAADAVVVLDAEAPVDGAGRRESMQRRDGWFAATCAEALVVWDGDDPAVEVVAESLRATMGDDAVAFVDPEVATAGGG